MTSPHVPRTCHGFQHAAAFHPVRRPALGAPVKTLPRDPLLLRAAALASNVLPGLREKDRGAGGHDASLAGLQSALKRAGVAQPTLVVVRPRLEANIAAVRAALAPTHLGLRVVS